MGAYEKIRFKGWTMNQPMSMELKHQGLYGFRKMVWLIKYF